MKQATIRKLALGLTISLPPLISIPLWLTTSTFNTNHQNQVNPEDLFDLEWKPSAAVIVQPPSGHNFQDQVDKMLSNQQLNLNWKFNLVAPDQLLITSDLSDLTNAFDLNYFAQDHYTNDINWKFQAINVISHTKDQIEVEFEIYEYDQNHYATGQVATVRQTFSLKNQIADPNQYYKQILNQIELVRIHDLSNVSFATLFNASATQAAFNKWWNLPQVLGAKLSIFIPSQLVTNEMQYTLQIKSQYYQENLNGIYQFEQNFQVGLINGADFAKANDFLQSWKQANTLTFVNDQTIKALTFDQNWSNFATQRVDFSGFNDLRFTNGFQFFRSKYSNQGEWFGQIKFSKTLKKLETPDQARLRIQFGSDFINLPHNSDPVHLIKWSRYFNYYIADTSGFLANYLDPNVIQTLFGNWPIYDATTKTLNLELLQQWILQHQDLKTENINLALANLYLNQIGDISQIILPLNLVGTNQPWDQAINLSKLLIDWAQVKNVQFASQYYLQLPDAPQNLYERFDARDLAFLKSHEVGFEKLVIPPSVLIFEYPAFVSETDTYNDFAISDLPFKIERQLDSKITDLVKSPILNLNQSLKDLDLNLINPNLANLTQLNQVQISAVFNTFNLEQNQNLYQSVKTIRYDLSSWEGIWDTSGSLLNNVLLKDNLGFLFNQPDWDRLQASNWLNNPLVVANSTNRDLEISVKDQANLNKIYQELIGSKSTSVARVIFQANHFTITKLLTNPNQPIKQPSFITNGVLDYQTYVKQFSDQDYQSSLINYQDQIKTIKIDPTVTTISARSLAGLRFSQNVTIDLKTIKTIEDQAFLATNLTYQNLDFAKIDQVGIYAFSANPQLESSIDLSKTTWKSIPDGLFAYNAQIKTLKLSPTIKTIGNLAFIGNDITNDLTKPLDLTNVRTIGAYGFSFNNHLEKVLTSKQYQVFQGFEFSGLKTFDFKNIKILKNVSDVWNKQVPLVLANFQDQTLDWSAIVNVEGEFQLPSVTKIILNPNTNLVRSIRGLTNLKTLVNYHQDVNPQLFFGIGANGQYQLENANLVPVEAKQIGYDITTGILNWDLAMPKQESGLIDSQYNSFVNQTQRYFQAHPDAIINQLILPNDGRVWEWRYNDLLTSLKLPPIKLLTMVKSPISTDRFDGKILNQFLQNQIISTIDPDFFASFSTIPYGVFRNVSFTQSDQFLNLDHISNISSYAFWNSSITQIKGLDQVKQAVSIEDYAFNRDIKIKINKKVAWTKKSFGLDIFTNLPANIELIGYPDTIDQTLGGYYNPNLKILDFSSLKPFANDNVEKTFVQTIQSLLRSTHINVLVLPNWSVIKNWWLSGWLVVNKLVISNQSLHFGVLGDPKLQVSRATFKTIPKLNHTNIINDYSGFWKE